MHATISNLHESAMTDTKNKGGRPPAGRTPDKVRKEMEREALAATGGRRLELRLPGPAAADLAHIRRRESMATDTEAAIAALYYFARRKLRNTKMYDKGEKLRIMGAGNIIIDRAAGTLRPSTLVVAQRLVNKRSPAKARVRLHEIERMVGKPDSGAKWVWLDHDGQRPVG